MLLVCVLPAVVAGGARAGTAKSTAVRTADAAIRQLNAERAATGIPGRIVENRAWSERCLEHARWMQQNHLVQHALAQPGLPGPQQPLHELAHLPVGREGPDAFERAAAGEQRSGKPCRMVGLGGTQASQ